MSLPTVATDPLLGEAVGRNRHPPQEDFDLQEMDGSNILNNDTTPY